MRAEVGSVGLGGPALPVRDVAADVRERDDSGARAGGSAWPLRPDGSFEMVLPAHQ